MIKRASTLARHIAALISKKKGDDIIVLDLRRHSPIADFFVIATAMSSAHAQAISDAIEQGMKRTGGRPHHVEGYSLANWVLIDYISVVVHIFVAEVRSFYGLERLWGDVPAERFSDARDAEND